MIEQHRLRSRLCVYVRGFGGVPFRRRWVSKLGICAQSKVEKWKMKTTGQSVRDLEKRLSRG